MENKVELSLEYYTKLIIENHDYKNKLMALETGQMKELKGRVKENVIDNLPRVKCLEYLTEKEDVVLNELTNTYSWSFRDASFETCGIISEKEFKEKLVAYIRDLIKSRIECLEEEEGI